MTLDDWTIDSPRLHLRPFTPGDADEAFVAITPGLTRYMAFEPPPSKEAFAAVWRTWLLTIADGTDITLVIRRRGDGVFLGLAGLHRAREAEPELGIWIAEVMHGHGYGREAVAAVWSAASGAFAVLRSATRWRNGTGPAVHWLSPLVGRLWHVSRA